MLPTATSALPHRQPGSAELRRAVERLGVVGSVLYVAAHPDDENTRLIAWLANEKLLRTAYLSITRGDGGQNLIGPEQGPLLGLIRTQELLAARAVDGGEQIFTRARDFGYSKTPDETMAIWGKDEVLADVVWAIRRFQPDVIVARFSTQGGDTHGHHTASARLIGEAFRAAADPRFRPEQLAHAPVWQARRLLWNKSSFQAKPGEDLAALPKVDIGAYNPALGLSYGEMAAESRSMHKSQGFGAARGRGENFEHFQPLDGETPPAGDLFGGIDFGWGRVPGAGKLPELIGKAVAGFRVEKPHASIPILLEIHQAIEKLPASPWRERKRQEVESLLLGCAGLFAEAVAPEHLVAAGDAVPVKVVALNRSAAPISLVEVRLPGGAAPVGQRLGENKSFELERPVAVPPGASPSHPHWLEKPPGPGLYAVQDPKAVGDPEGPAPLEVELILDLAGRKIALRTPVLFKWVDPVAGERTRRVEIAPPILVGAGTPQLLFPDGRAKTLDVTVEAAAAAGASGSVRLELPTGWRAVPTSAPFALAKKGDRVEQRFKVHPPAGRTGATEALRVVAEVGGKRFSRGLARIEHHHIPIQTLFPEAEVRLVRFELRRGPGAVGYIPGAGDEVPASLRQAGYQVTILDEAQLRDAPLSRFKAIVVGVRAYNTQAHLARYQPKLLQWVAAGGTLVLQYNTNNRLAKLSAALGPFPFEISTERVTDETAAVTLDGRHPLLAGPNAIGPADFQGWVQERGLYFAGKWDGRYQTPLSLHDPGEPPRLGSLLFARHGKGTFVYTGLAFFRQLPAGVPGAFRLFANLLAGGGG
jgi:LmbE family N-acetylglucosaminyl deacetylase